MRQILVVANQTLGGQGLLTAIQGRLDAGPAELWVLVPATEAHGSTDLAMLGPGGSAQITLPGGGAAGGATAEAAHHETDPVKVAERRLHDGLEKLRPLGAPVDGEVGDQDPLHAIGEVLARRKFDEIVISTLPSGVSRWLHTDLPSRVHRKFSLPVTTVTGH